MCRAPKHVRAKLKNIHSVKAGGACEFGIEGVVNWEVLDWEGQLGKQYVTTLFPKHVDTTVTRHSVGRSLLYRRVVALGVLVACMSAARHVL
jgi:hypothetical protein